MTASNTVPMSYNQFLTNIARLAVVNTVTTNSVVAFADPPLADLTPAIFNYAELRIQRDLDILPSLTSRTYVLNPGTNILAMDADDFITVQTLNVSVTNGAPSPMLPTSKEFIQNVYGSSATSGMPQYFAMTGGDVTTGGTNYNYITFGPYTDTTYNLNVYGTIRVPSLYYYHTDPDASTSYTYISTYYSDLMVQAAMVFVSQYQRDFNPTSNDPQMPGSYEMQYENLLKAAVVEEKRKRFEGSGWTSMAPATIATPNR